MASNTLILNQDYSPLSVLPLSSKPWQDSMKSWFADEMRPIEFYTDWNIRSAKQSWPVPSVLVCNKYIRKKHSVRYSRYNLLLRDNFKCQYCGTDLDLGSITIDHVFPRARGGVTKWENVTSACGRCNSAKGHKTNMKPKKLPSKPEYYQLASVICTKPIIIPHKNWIPYLPWDEKLITVQCEHD